MTHRHRRVDMWHPPRTPAAFSASGIVLLVGTFFPTNDRPGVTAAAGAVLIGLASWHHYLDSQSQAGNCVSLTVVAESSQRHHHNRHAA